MQQAAELYEEKEKDLYIQTVKGQRFYMSRPQFDIEEVAHALAMQCRYTGHVRTFYSVAEHSVMVSHMCERIADCQLVKRSIGENGEDDSLFQLPFDAAREGFLHDAHEAYFSDLASPWKVLVPDYRRVEHNLETAMRAHFGLPAQISEGVKFADWLSLFVEARELLPHGVSDDWLTPSEDFRGRLQVVLDSGDYYPESWEPRYAKRRFLERWRQLEYARTNPESI
jgi:uncharacterized protein